MDDSSTIDGDAPTLGSSVASVLGIKGSLRFRLHGSTQKAHVILRRVTISDDSSDDGEGRNIVRFSLFAHKRIEVKPGKEILLTVASEDGLFKDRPIVFEGDLMGEEELSSAEDDTQVAEEEEEVTYIPPPAPVVPPKMRRGWTKKVEEVSPITQRTYSSIAIQAEPVYVSTSILAQPSCVPASAQTHSALVSTSVQVDPPPLRSRVSTTAQTSDPLSSELQAGNKFVSTPGWVLTKENIRVERSLSPMELDSPTYSPTEFIPIESPEPLPPLDIGPSRARSPTRSSMGAEDMQMSPIETPTPLNPHESLLILPQVYSTAGGDSANRGNETKEVLSRVSSDTLSVVSSSMNHSVTSESNNMKMNVPRKPAAPNPFVSAGFMTEFVGLTSGQTSAVTTVTPSKTPVGKAIKIESPPPSQLILATKVEIKSNTTKLSSPSTTKGPPLKPKVPNLVIPSMLLGAAQPPPTVSPSLTTNPSQKPKKISVKLTSAFQNAVASSSKVPIDKPTHISPITSTIPNGPRSLAALSTRAREKSPALSTPLLGGRIQPHITTDVTLPPPDPKALAYIPSGPSSNPLNIRPSGNLPGHGTVPSKATQTAPKVLPQTSTKKRVIVGTGWPFVKASGASNSASTSASASSPPEPPTVPPPPPPPSGPRSLNLSNIISYSSPSPPPTPVASATKKWKRVASDISTGIAPDTPNLSHSWSGSVEEDCKNANPVTVTPQSSRLSSNTVAKSPTVSLKDRIGPATTPQSKHTSNPERLLKALNGPDPRDLLSRISDPPVVQTRTNTSPEVRKNKAGPPPPTAPTPSPQEASSRPSNMYNMPTNAHTNGPNPLISASPSTPATPSFTHPLPQKPVVTTGGNNTARGVKRERPPSPDLSMDFPRQRKRSFRWPTVDSNYSALLKGEGELGIRVITFSSDGSHFALSCADKTIRIWNNRDRVEIARLSHNSPIVALSWMHGDTGVVSLGEDGIISKWTRSGQNHWHWAKVLDAGNERLSEDDQVCMVYWRDRIAVSFPRGGVKVWMWSKGTWQAQRAILRQNVSAIRFVDDGAALLGGTRDGVLWYCEIPNGTLRAYAFLKNKINSLDLSPTGSHVLVGQTGGCARLVGIRQSDNKGAIEQSYSCKETEARPNGGFGATFATQGQAILFGNVEGCVLVWDRKKGAIVYGLEHEEDDLIQAVASFDGLLSTRYGCLVTGTKKGQLAWWSQPVAATHTDDSNKRPKTGA